jgi:cobaltochelatase CobT
MLKEGLLKENIDGEAINWALSRLKKEEKREKF